jgi:uncharacterized protein with HEPN domain
MLSLDAYKLWQNQLERLSEELKANIPDVDWRNISGFRKYFST